MGKYSGEVSDLPINSEFCFLIVTMRCLFGTHQLISLGLQGAAIEAAAQPQHDVGMPTQAALLVLVEHPKNMREPQMSYESDPFFSLAFKTLWLVLHLRFAVLGEDSNDTRAARKWWDLPCK